MYGSTNYQVGRQVLLGGDEMVQPLSTAKLSSDAVLAVSLAKLWPHREHESGIKSLFAALVGMVGVN